MASTYSRKDSPFIWIRFRTPEGKWQGKNTGFRRDNPGDRKQAKNLAQKMSLEEMISKAARTGGSAWNEWVAAWINSRWGDIQKPKTTAHLYGRFLHKWLQYFEKQGITTPALFHREHIDSYLAWRAQNGAGRNSCIHEIKFLAQVFDEAIARGFVTSNPARKLRLKPDAPAEKHVWGDDEVTKVLAALEECNRYGWMHVAILMGLHQAVRIRQSTIPLSSIDFNRRLINYPAAFMKGGKAHSQPISPVFINTLREIVEHRRKLGKSTLTDIPDHYRGAQPASVQLRKFLDSLGLRHLCHHGLRATWITQAALRGIPESLAMRFVNHSSKQVHEIYQKITATDLMPMLDAFLLARPNALALPAR